MFAFSSSAEEDDLRPAMLIWDDWDSLDNIQDCAPVDGSSLPNAVDLTATFPTPGDQGNQGSCSAWAVGYALKSAQETKKYNWSTSSTAHQFSPAYIYNQINGGMDCGSSISEAMSFVVEEGVCSLNYFSYDQNNYTNQPDAKAVAAASMYKAQSWMKLDSLNEIKKVLSQGFGVVIGVQVYPDFDDIKDENDTYDTISGTSRGGHAICLIGYDDAKGAFKFINSWGTDWGLNGYGWISYNLVSNTTVNHHGANRGYALLNRTSDQYQLGDVNEDGTITAADGRLALRYSSQLETPTAMQFVLADTNGDALVTAADAREIMNYSAGTLNKFSLYT